MKLTLRQLFPLGTLLLATATVAQTQPAAPEASPPPAQPVALHLTPIPDNSDYNDASIRRILDVVSRRQLHPLKDGDYAPVDSVKAAAAARPPKGVGGNYPTGVVLYGVIRSTDLTGNREALNFVLEHNRIVARHHAWLAVVADKVSDRPEGAKIRDTPEWATFIHDYNKVPIGRLLHLGMLDHCGAMGAQILEGMLRCPDQVIPEQKALVARVAEWIVHCQERLPDGTFWRPYLGIGSADNIWQRDAVWADDLYMSCPFLVRWAKYTGETKHLHDAARQVINMAARLQDADGLWFHAWFESEKKHSPFKWGRANGWAMVATVEVLSALPEDHPDRAAVLDILRRHIEGVKKLQAASGLWRQVLDHPELWEETSCTAMFAYSIARAVNRGWIDEANMAVARKAFEGLCKRITPEGMVKGTCEGTNIGLTLDYYANRKQPDDDMHSRGVVLLAGTEILAAQK